MVQVSKKLPSYRWTHLKDTPHQPRPSSRSIIERRGIFSDPQWDTVVICMARIYDEANRGDYYPYRSNVEKVLAYISDDTYRHVALTTALLTMLNKFDPMHMLSVMVDTEKLADITLSNVRQHRQITQELLEAVVNTANATRIGGFLKLVDYLMDATEAYA